MVSLKYLQFSELSSRTRGNHVNVEYGNLLADESPANAAVQCRTNATGACRKAKVSQQIHARNVVRKVLLSIAQAASPLLGRRK